MSAGVVQKSEKRHSSGSFTYPGVAEPLKVPRTPLESRQGYHPKQDELVWKSPPTRQLSREKRAEYESDIRERFYDDYIGQRRTGDARNEVTTGVSKLGFDPAIYRANALQSLVYDPLRPVPAGVDFQAALRVERTKERRRQIEQFRQRRLSDSHLLSKPSWDHQTHLEPLLPQKQLTGPPLSFPQERPRSALQKSLDDSLNPEIVPAVEGWLAGASKKDQDTAVKFFRTVSSHGKRPDPAAKASLHTTRVRSAVMTPLRKQREEKAAQSYFQHLARDTGAFDVHDKRKAEPPKKRQLRRSTSERVTTKGSMFTATRQQPSHFTVHPEWASETLDPFKKK